MASTFINLLFLPDVVLSFIYIANTFLREYVLENLKMVLFKKSARALKLDHTLAATTRMHPVVAPFDLVSTPPVNNVITDFPNS